MLYYRIVRQGYRCSLKDKKKYITLTVQLSGNNVLWSAPYSITVNCK